MITFKTLRFLSLGSNTGDIITLIQVLKFQDRIAVCYRNHVIGNFNKWRVFFFSNLRILCTNVHFVLKWLKIIHPIT